MTDKSLKFILENRIYVFLLVIVLVVYGAVSISRLTIDAVPDITNVQVLVNTKTGGLDPEQVEKNITYYIENEMAGLPGVTEVRSLSRFGLSQVVVVFRDGTDIFRARQLITEKLQSVQGALPDRITPELGPISTGLGEVVMYAVLPVKGSALESKSEVDKLIYLRTIQDYLIRPYLKSHITGVADIDSLGGYKKQININVDPARLEQYGVTFNDLIHNFQSIGENYGGGYIEKDNKQIIVRTQGELSLEGIGNLPAKLNVFGSKIHLRKLSEVREGHSQRVGASTEKGREAVTGIVLMLLGANSQEVSLAAEKAIAELPLPEDVEVKVLYTRNYLINQTLKTVSTNLMEGASLVIIILFLILGNIRAAFIVSLAIPLSMMFATIWMYHTGISANLMSLGAIDFGLLVDASVVLIENIIRNMEMARKKLSLGEKISLIISSAKEVAGPVVLGLIIIMAVYIPILTLEGVEGKMFHPMAMTVLFALAGSLVVATVIMPVFGLIAIKEKEKHHDPLIFRVINKYYTIILDFVLALDRKSRQIVIASVVLFFLFTVFLFTRMGSDFIPSLDEGDLVINLVHPSDISLSASIERQIETEKYIMTLGEVKEVFSRMGTPESATDPMGVNLIDTFLILKPDRNEWPLHNGKRFTRDELFNQIRDHLAKIYPETEVMANQPIEMRFNEILEGSRADVSVRIYGKDLNQLTELQNRTVELLQKIDGAEEVELDALTALRKSPVMNVRIRYDEISRYNIHLQEVNDIVETAMAGRQIGYFYDYDWRFPIVVRLGDKFRGDMNEIRKIPVSLPEGGTIPLGRITDIGITNNVTSIARSGGSRYAGVAVNLSGRDVASFVKEAKETLDKNLALPSGYRLYWGGQFKNLERAQAKLMIVIPVILLVIFFLVYQNFKSVLHTVMVYMGIPFSVTGGILALYLRGINFSVSAAIGFITLSGIAILNGMVLVSFIKQLQESGMKTIDAVREGSLIRLRPVIMTAMVASFGFMPMALNTGMGAEVQRPLATVVVGGLVTSTLLTLVLLPMFYLMFRKERS